MKTRNGFVSNSSSSSFVLAVRKGHNVRELLEGMHPIPWMFAEPVINFLSEQKLLPVGEALKNFFCCDNDMEYVLERSADILALIEGEDLDDWLLVCGDASDFDRDNIGETTLCYATVEHDEGDIRLWSQGGY